MDYLMIGKEIEKFIVAWNHNYKETESINSKQSSVSNPVPLNCPTYQILIYFPLEGPKPSPIYH